MSPLVNTSGSGERSGENDLISGWHATSLSLEFASPVNLNFGYDRYRNPTYGYGLSLGYYIEGGKNKGFFTFKRANGPGIALGASIDFINFEAQVKDLNFKFHQGLYGHGVEYSANMFIGYSKGQDTDILNPYNYTPKLRTTALSVGLGFDVGFSEWSTFTNTFGN